MGKFTHFWYGKFWVNVDEAGIMSVDKQQILSAGTKITVTVFDVHKMEACFLC